MTPRHTIVLANSLYDQVVGGASAIVARPVTGERGVLLLGQRVGRDPAEGEVSVVCGPGGLELTSRSAATRRGGAGHIPAHGQR